MHNSKIPSKQKNPKSNPFIKSNGVIKPAQPAAAVEIVEFYDNQQRLLLLGPRSESYAYKLWVKAVGVILYTPPLENPKYYITKRSTYYSNFKPAWDLSAVGHVKQHESLFDCAQRALKEQVGIESIPLVHHSTFNPEGDLNIKQELLQVNIFVAGPCYDLPKDAGILVDIDELLGLAATMPENLTPALNWMINSYLPQINS